MISEIQFKKVLEFSDTIPVIDVRSPSEYQHGCIPNAVNLPLFNDEERARVGTIYKQKGKNAAFEEGLRISGPKLPWYLENARKYTAGSNSLILYCWRGGQRSHSLGWLFDQAGINVYIVEGGYKAFRRFVKASFSSPAQLFILGGMTGSGKTKILQAMSSLQQQVIDLEKIASHRGSVFGGLSHLRQPTTEHFENLLFAEWIKMDLHKPVWLEDESKSVGRVFIPDELFIPMKQSTLVEIVSPDDLRIQNLVEEYSQEKTDVLINNVRKIEKRLGGMVTRDCIAAIEKKNYVRAAGLLLSYYDKAYRMSMSKNKRENIIQISLKNNNPLHNAKTILHTLCSNVRYSSLFCE